MEVKLKRRLLTINEYHLMIQAGIFSEDDPLELLNGEIVYMSPVGNLHIGCVNRLNTRLNNLLSDKAIISVQNPVGLDIQSEPEPDVSVCKLRDDFYGDSIAKPEDIYLIIEVADTSLEKDREAKLPIYAAAGIPVYWIVNLKDRQVEVYHTPFEKLYKVREISTLGDVLHLASLDLTLPVEDVLG